MSTTMDGWTSWTDYIGNLDLNAIYDLGNQWIRMGDELYRQKTNLTDAIGALGWRGTAFTTAQDTWLNHMTVVLDDAADAAWKTGEGINAYADDIKKQAEKMADENNKAYLINIFGFFLGVVTAPLTFALGALLPLLAEIAASLVEVIGQLAARLGTLGTIAAQFTVGAVTGAVSSFAIDMAANALASAATHTSVTIDWAHEGLNIGLGAALGGVLGGGLGGLAAKGGKFSGFDLPPGSVPTGAPKGGPGGGKPSNPTSSGGSGGSHPNGSNIPGSAMPHDTTLNPGGTKGSPSPGSVNGHPSPTPSTPSNARPGTGPSRSGAPVSGRPQGEGAPPPAVSGPSRSNEVVGGYPKGQNGSSSGPARPQPIESGNGTVAQPKGPGAGNGNPTVAPKSPGPDGTVPPSNLEKVPTSSGPVSTPPGAPAPRAGGDQGPAGSRGSGGDGAVVTGPGGNARSVPPSSGSGHGVPGAEPPRVGSPG
ncbi:MAG TPA: hypothetical protein VGP70_19955, partial [Actinomadura sp.]|nr:hypothetical protein [Actinomadura sp.]